MGFFFRKGRMTKQFPNSRRCNSIDLFLQTTYILYETAVLGCLAVFITLLTPSEREAPLPTLVNEMKESKNDRKNAGELTRPPRPLHRDSSPHSGGDLQKKKRSKRKVEVTLTAMTSATPDGDASLVAPKFHNAPVCYPQELHKTHCMRVE